MTPIEQIQQRMQENVVELSQLIAEFAARTDFPHTVSEHLCASYAKAVTDSTKKIIGGVCGWKN